MQRNNMYRENEQNRSTNSWPIRKRKSSGFANPANCANWKKKTRAEVARA